MVKAAGIAPEALVPRFCSGGGTCVGGATFKHPEFAEVGDDETGVAMYKCENGAQGVVHVGCTAAYGYHVEMEVIGTGNLVKVQY